MSEEIHRERAAAVAALDSSPTVHDEGDESVVAPAPTQAHPVVAPPRGPSTAAIATGGGIFALLATLDQWLKQHGATLADLTMNSGPLSGAAVANGPLILLGVALAWWVAQKWQEDRRERLADREWARQRAIAVDRHARAQVRAIRAVAAGVDAVRTELSSEAAERRNLAGRVDAVERDVRDIRARLPERRQQPRVVD